MKPRGVVVACGVDVCYSAFTDPHRCRVDEVVLDEVVLDGW